MSKFSEFIKNQKQKDMDYYFNAGYKMISNKYFKFEHIIDSDNIILVTSNIKILKDNYVLVIDNNKVVYLKDWQVREVHNYDLGINAYVVKLSRNYFKPYTFNFSFEDISFNEECTFDALYDLAKLQNSDKTTWAFGSL